MSYLAKNCHVYQLCRSSLLIAIIRPKALKFKR